MNNSPHLTKAVRGPTLWIQRAEFGGAVFFGFAFLFVLIVAIGVWSHVEMKRQAESFTIALTTIDGMPDLIPPAQREAVLLKRDDVYHWRAIVWHNTEAGRTPLIWSAHINATTPMVVAETSLLAYDAERARALELPPVLAPPSAPQ